MTQVGGDWTPSSREAEPLSLLISGPRGRAPAQTTDHPSSLRPSASRRLRVPTWTICGNPLHSSGCPLPFRLPRPWHPGGTSLPGLPRGSTFLPGDSPPTPHTQHSRAGSGLPPAGCPMPDYPGRGGPAHQMAHVCCPWDPSHPHCLQSGFAQGWGQLSVRDEPHLPLMPEDGSTRPSRPGCCPSELWGPHAQERPYRPAFSIPSQHPEGWLPPSRGCDSGGTEPWTRTALKGGLEYSLGQHCGVSSKPRVLHRRWLCPLRAKGGSRSPSCSGPASPGSGPHTKLTRGDLPLGASERGGRP